ncbi:MAG: EF-hand domain-containing protein [Pirellulales bacterium]
MATKYWVLAVCISLVSSVAWAQEPKRDPRDPDQRKQRIEKFDKDGDGKLNKEEKTAAREAARVRRGDGDQRAKGRREGAGGEGLQRGQRGPKDFMADPGAMFDRIDSDRDGNVTKEQFVKFMEKMRAQFGQRGEGSQRGKDGKRGGSGRQARPPR